MTHETTDDIALRISRDRAALGDTIDAIQDKFSPGQLLDQAMSYVKSGGGDFAAGLGRSVRENPIPLVLTGVGLTWLIASSMSGGNRSAQDDMENYRPYDELVARARRAESGVARDSGESDSAFQTRVTQAKAKALNLKQQASETADDFKRRIDRHVHDAETKAASLRERAAHALAQGRANLSSQAEMARVRGQQAQARAKQLYEAEPLIAGAMGVLAGAIIGALLPTSRAEERYLGEYGQQLRRGVAGAAAGAAKSAESAVADAAQAAERDSTSAGNSRAEKGTGSAGSVA